MYSSSRAPPADVYSSNNGVLSVSAHTVMSAPGNAGMLRHSQTVWEIAFWKDSSFPECVRAPDLKICQLELASKIVPDHQMCLTVIRISSAGGSACGVGLDLAMDEAGFVVVSGVDARCPKTVERGDAIVRVDGFDVRGMRASEV